MVWRPKVQFYIYVISKIYYECYKRGFDLKYGFFWYVLRGKSTILNVCYFLGGQDQIITHIIEKLYVWVYPILMPHTRLREHVVVPETVQCKNWFRHIMVNYGDCPQRSYEKLPKYPGDVVECDGTEHILVNRVPGIIRYKNHVKALHSFYYHFGALYTWWSFSLFGHGAFLKGLFSTPNLMRNFL